MAFKFFGEVVSLYKADVSDHKQKIKQLRGEEQKAQKERLGEIEAHNKKLEGHIGTLGKVGIAVGAVGAAYLVAKESFDTYAENARLQSAAAGANIDALRKSSHGLLEEQKLLKFAAAAMNTDFKLSQSEMQEVSKYMIVLRNQGNDLEEVYREVTKAIVETNTEGLKKFGVQVKAASGTLEAHEQIMQRIREENNKAGNDIERAGDQITQATNQIADAFRELKIILGGILEMITPIISGLANIGNAVNFRLGIGHSAAEQIALTTQLRNSLVGGQLQRNQDAEIERAKRLAGFYRESHNPNTLKSTIKELSEAVADGMKKWTVETKKGGRGSSSRPSIDTELSPGQEAMFKNAFSQVLGLRKADTPSRDYTAGFGQTGEGFGEEFAGFHSDLNAQATKGKRQLFLHSILGAPNEFSADVIAYSAGFSTIQAASLAAFDAMVTGSEGVVHAIRRAIADSLKAIGAQMLVEALKETGYGIASLAWHDYGAAKQHFAAAGAFTLAATAAGVASRAVAPSASSSASNASSSATASGNSMFGTDHLGQGRSVTVFIGNDFGTHDRRQSQEKLRKSLSDANITGSDSQVVFG